MTLQPPHFGCRDTSIFSAPAGNSQARLAKTDLAKHIYQKSNNSFFEEISRTPLRDNFEKDLHDRFDPAQKPDYEGHQIEGIGVYTSSQAGDVTTTKVMGSHWRNQLGQFMGIFNDFGQNDRKILGMHARFTDENEIVEPATARLRLHPYQLAQSDAILTHHGGTADAASWLKQTLKPIGQHATDSALLAQYFDRAIQKEAPGKKLKDVPLNEAISIFQSAFKDLLESSSTASGKRGTFNIRLFDGSRQFVLCFVEPIVIPGQKPRPSKFPMIAIHTRPEDDRQDLIVSLEPKRLKSNIEAHLSTWDKLPHGSSGGITPVHYHNKWGILPHNSLTAFEILPNGHIQRNMYPLLIQEPRTDSKK